MASAIREMLASEEFRNTCGNNARKVVEMLNPQKIYGEWEKVIEEATK
jgi:glycosyltransferase involved in cell wall biosynthesis